jgi:hypothetical protein
LKRLILSISIAASVLSLLFPQASFATAKSEFALDPRYGQIVSYEKLMRLSPKKREIYLEAVRQLVRDVEKMQRDKAKLFADESDSKRLNVYLDLLNRFIEEAQAAQEVRRTPFYGDRNRPSCNPPFALVRAKMTGDDGNLQNYVCVLADKSAPKTEKDTWHYTPKASKSCEVGTVLVKGPEGKTFCATDESYKKMRPDLRAIITPPPAPPKAAAPAVARKAAEVKKPKAPKKLSAAADDKGSSATEAASDSPTAKEDLPEDVVLCAVEGEGEKAFTSIKSGPGFEKFCNDETIAAARARFYSEARRDCVFAGNFLSYKEGAKAPGRCNTSSKFCFGDFPSCKNEKGEAVADGGLSFSCNDPKQQICNPLVYGVKKGTSPKFLSGEPFCVTANSGATAACEDAVKKEVPTLLFNAANTVNMPGIMETWNKFASDFNSMCNGEGAGKQFNCRECELIRNRLFATAVAIGAQEKENCGNLLPFSQTQLEKRKELCEKHPEFACSATKTETLNDDVVGFTLPPANDATKAKP